MHEATVAVCPVTRTAMRNTRSHPGGISSVQPGTPRDQQPIVVPRPPGADVPLPPRSARRSLIGQTIDGKYKVRTALGEGGMGAVFEAEHAAIGRIVAIKVLHPAQASKKVAVKRFHQEARAAGAIGHPNICEVFDFGTLADSSPYLVMERLQGDTLSARIGEQGGLPFLEVIDIVAQVLSGLAAAHERGILHRDIKPENVFLAERPGYPAIVKLLDFGVSKVVGGATLSEWDDETLTKTGMVMGTPFYMSPEQARGDRNLDGRVDLYACGVVLYEALTGQRPFNAKNYNTLLVSILDGKAKSPRELRPTIPVELEAVVLKGMANDRALRFQTAAEFSQALAAVRRELVHQPGNPSSSRILATAPASHSSAEIPIHFASEPASSTSTGDDWGLTTSPQVPLPAASQSADEGSPYDDGSGGRDTLFDADKRVKDDGEDRTDRMDRAEIQRIVDARDRRK